MILIIRPPQVENKTPVDSYSRAVFFKGKIVPYAVYGGLEKQLIAVNFPIHPEDQREVTAVIKSNPEYHDAQVIYPSLEVIE